jgi:hypothetical protein
MTARATKRISQPDSYHSAPNRSATTRATYSIATSHSDTTACTAPPAQALPRDSVRGQNPKGRSVSDRTVCAASSAQVVNKRRGGHPATTTCAASPAQSTAASLLAARIRKAGRNLTAPLARRHPRKSSACRRPRPAERKPTKDNSNGFESSEVNRRYCD